MNDIKILEFPQFRVERPQVELLYLDYMYDDPQENGEISEPPMKREMDISDGFSQGSVKMNRIRIDLEMYYDEDISQEIAKYLYSNVNYLNMENNSEIYSIINVREIYSKTHSLNIDELNKNVKQKITLFNSFCATSNRYGAPNKCVANTETFKKYKTFLPESIETVINDNIKDNDMFFILSNDSIPESPGIKYYDYKDPFSENYFYKICKTSKNKYTEYQLTIKE